MSTFRYLRKLILGETWTLPAGLAVALLASALIGRLLGHQGWWPAGGGFVLLALVLVALTASLAEALARRPR